MLVNSIQLTVFVPNEAAYICASAFAGLKQSRKQPAIKTRERISCSFPKLLAGPYVYITEQALVSFRSTADALCPFGNRA